MTGDLLLIGVPFVVCPKCGLAAEWYTGLTPVATKNDLRLEVPVRCVCGWTSTEPRCVAVSKGEPTP